MCPSSGHPGQCCPQATTELTHSPPEPYHDPPLMAKQNRWSPWADLRRAWGPVEVGGLFRAMWWQGVPKGRSQFFFVIQGATFFFGLGPGAVRYPPSAVGYPPTAVGCRPAIVGCPPTAVGSPPTAVGSPPPNPKNGSIFVGSLAEYLRDRIPTGNVGVKRPIILDKLLPLVATEGCGAHSPKFGPTTRTGGCRG